MINNNFRRSRILKPRCVAASRDFTPTSFRHVSPIPTVVELSTTTVLIGGETAAIHADRAQTREAIVQQKQATLQLRRNVQRFSEHLDEVEAATTAAEREQLQYQRPHSVLLASRLTVDAHRPSPRPLFELVPAGRSTREKPRCSQRSYQPYYGRDGSNMLAARSRNQALTFAGRTPDVRSASENAPSAT